MQQQQADVFMNEDTIARRHVDGKSRQLKSISHLSALLAGFSTVMLVEVTIPSAISPLLVTFFCVSTCLVVQY